MSDNEIEDVSFLPGPGHGGTSKKSVYEPAGPQHCKQLICSRSKAIFVITIVMLLILVIALLAAFAHTPCASPQSLVKTNKSNETVNYYDKAGKLFPWQHIRLPKSITPVAYHILIQPDMKRFIYSGNIAITLLVLENTPNVIFHSKQLNITSSSVVDVKKNPIKSNGIFECEALEQIAVTLQKPLLAKSTYTITIHFDGILSDDMRGFYRSSYMDETGNTRWIATTQFEPTSARKAFPCWDEPAMKATFSMEIVRDKNEISLFNTPLASSRDDARSHSVIDSFEKTVKMSTYLVAFIVCDYVAVRNETKTGIKVAVYTPRHLKKQAAYAVDAATEILAYYEEFFEVKYPLKKQDMVAIPDFSAGAMENWGLITYRLTAVLYDEKVSSMHNKQRVATVIAHELAHQWFGNLVTMKWWNDLWLNEGFATFVEYIGTDRIEPDLKMLDQFVIMQYVSALEADSLSSSHPISVQVDNPGSISEIFDSISYDKGSSIIRMCEGFIGRKQLQNGLKKYLTKYKFSNAETADLWTCLSTAEINVKQIMATWTGQMGYPVVFVSLRHGHVNLHQQRFLLTNYSFQKQENSTYGYKWYIPVTYETNRGASELIWMNMKSRDFSVNEDTKWIKLNSKQTGFFRVDYQKSLWLALIDQLHLNHSVFASSDRAGLIGDVFAMARCGRQPIGLALNMSKYAVKEKEYVPLSMLLNNLQLIVRVVEGKNIEASFKAWGIGLFRSLLKDLGWHDDGSLLQRYLRSRLIAAALLWDDPGAIAEATQKFRMWKDNGTEIEPEFRDIVYSAGIRHGGKDEWEFAWRKSQSAQVASEKIRLLMSLSATQDSTLLQRLLKMSLDESKVKRQDSTMVLSAIAAGSEAGRILAWAHFKRNIEIIKERFGGSSFEITTIVRSVAGHFKTIADFEDVKSYFTRIKISSAKRAIFQALESIRINIDWLEHNLNPLIEWLQHHGNSQ